MTAQSEKVALLETVVREHVQTCSMLRKTTYTGLTIIITLLIAIAGQVFYVGTQHAGIYERLEFLNQRVGEIRQDIRGTR